MSCETLMTMELLSPEGENGARDVGVGEQAALSRAGGEPPVGQAAAGRILAAISDAKTVVVSPRAQGSTLPGRVSR